MKQLYLLTLFFLILIGLARAQPLKDYSAISNDTGFKEKRYDIEAASAALIGKINQAYHQNNRSILLNDSLATERGKSSIKRLLAHHGLMCMERVFEVSVLPEGQGYRVGKIWCRSTENTRFEISFNYLTDGRLDSVVVDAAIELPELALHPLAIKSEKKGLDIRLIEKDGFDYFELDSCHTTPAELFLPYGRYKLELSRKGHPTYSGNLIHKQNLNKTKQLPSYSRMSFHFLATDFVDMNSLESSFGRMVFLPGTGLSTALLNAHYQIFEIMGDDDVIREYETLIPGIFLLNWDWRIGGAIHRRLDVCALGRIKWSPGLRAINTRVDHYYDATLWNYFLGIEVSTRLSFINLNMKLGHQVFDGGINIWSDESNSYLDNDINVLMSRTILSFGMTINFKTSSTNNVLRLWHKPLINQLIDGL